MTDFHFLQLFSFISVDAKLSAGRLKDDVLARITVAMPKPRDSVIRGPSIPGSVSAVKMSVENGERIQLQEMKISHALDEREKLGKNHQKIPHLMNGLQ